VSEEEHAAIKMAAEADERSVVGWVRKQILDLFVEEPETEENDAGA
jgi:hypothetical protein